MRSANVFLTSMVSWDASEYAREINRWDPGPLDATQSNRCAPVNFQTAIAMLAFTDGDLLGAAKLGVLVGLLVTAMLGLAWGVAYVRHLRRETDAHCSVSSD